MVCYAVLCCAALCYGMLCYELQEDPLTREEWVRYSVYDAQGTYLLFQEHSIL